MPIVRLVLLMVVAGTVGGCVTPGSGTPTGPPALPGDRAPRITPDWLARLPDPVPMAEPPSVLGNPSSYVVDGVTYHVAPTAVGYRQSGVASWYGVKFHGRRTSSGEPYDMYKLSAAHRSLPIPTYARVTNLENGRSTIVRINDRGPFHDARLIDLSYAAAVKLGFADHGVARVRVEALESPAPRTYHLQVGAFSSLDAADRVVAHLRDLLEDAPVSVASTDGDLTLYRVRIGPVRGDDEKARVMAALAGTDFGPPIVTEL